MHPDILFFSKFQTFHQLEDTPQLFLCCSYCVYLHWRRLLKIMWAFAYLSLSFLQFVYLQTLYALHISQYCVSNSFICYICYWNFITWPLMQISKAHSYADLFLISDDIIDLWLLVFLNFPCSIICALFRHVCFIISFRLYNQCEQLMSILYIITIYIINIWRPSTLMACNI